MQTEESNFSGLGFLRMLLGLCAVPLAAGAALAGVLWAIAGITLQSFTVSPVHIVAYGTAACMLYQLMKPCYSLCVDVKLTLKWSDKSGSTRVILLCMTYLCVIGGWVVLYWVRR